MAWLSPSYPVGAFSYSSGIEWAVEAGDIKRCGVRSATGFRSCSQTAADLRRGLFRPRLSRHRERQRLSRAVAELAAAFTPSKERKLETRAGPRLP